jgi:hypothetical protein
MRTILLILALNPQTHLPLGRDRLLVVPAIALGVKYGTTISSSVVVLGRRSPAFAHEW